MEWKIFYYPCVLDREKYVREDSIGFDDDTFNEAVFDQTSGKVYQDEKINLFINLDEAEEVCKILPISKPTMVRTVAKFEVADSEKEGYISKININAIRGHFTCWGRPFIETYCEVYE